MKLHDPQTRVLLAGEYVLGTLQGPARRRFDALLAEDAALQREVDQWEAQLYALMARDLTPEEPSSGVYERVMQRAGFGIDSAAAEPMPRGRSRRRSRRRVWAAAAIAASAAVVALLLPETVQHTEPPQVAEPELQPLMQLEVAQIGAQWTVGLRDDTPVVAAPEAGVVPPEGQDYELWWVDPEGTPHSLGVLPRAGERRVSVPEAGAGLDSGALAVSREPEGGAPEGSPGEVLEVFPL